MSGSNDELEEGEREWEGEQETEGEREGKGEGKVLTVDGSSQHSTMTANRSLQSSPLTTHHPTPDEEETSTTLAAAASGNILTAITERVKRLDSRLASM